MNRLPRLGKREHICLLLFTFNYVVSVWRGFLFLYVILLWQSLSLSYNYFEKVDWHIAFGACVSLFVPTVTFKLLKLES